MGPESKTYFIKVVGQTEKTFIEHIQKKKQIVKTFKLIVQD